MSEDIISRKAAIDAVLNLNVENRVSWRDAVIDTIDALPSAQPEIVRCNDCKWKQGSECVKFSDVRPFPDDFCSRGEKM